MDIDKIEPDIRAKLPKNLYGLKNFLMYGLHKDMDGYYIKKHRRYVENGYDCFEAALATQEILRKHDIVSDIYKGVDELDLFKAHFFLISEDGLIIDGVPLYPFVGAQHLPQEKCTPKRISSTIKNERATFNTIVPVSSIIDGEEEFVTQCGITGGARTIEEELEELKSGLSTPIVVTLQSTRIVDRKPVDTIRTDATVDRSKYWKIRRDYPPLPYGSSIDERIERIKKLEELGVVNTSQNIYRLNLVMPGFTELFDSKIVRQTKEVHDQDYDVFSYMIENAPFATPAIEITF